jgi:hypothetical protein
VIGSGDRVTRLSAVILALAVLVAGCGGNHDASSSSSSASASASAAIPSKASLAASACVKGRPVLEARLRVGAGAVTGRLVKTSSGAPQCDFRVSGRPPRSSSLSLWVSLDNSPQPYQVLDRRSVEEGQNFAFAPHFKSPLSIKHLGLIGWWFPREQQTQTTDGRILITVTIVSWPRRGSGQRVALSAAVARTYLGPLLRGARLVAS